MDYIFFKLFIIPVTSTCNHVIYNQLVELLTRDRSVVRSIPINGSRCFLNHKQESLTSLLRKVLFGCMMPSHELHGRWVQLSYNISLLLF